MEPAYTIVGDPSPVVAVAVHAGHALRPEVANALALDDASRRREEDPATDRLVSIVPTQVAVHRSRFEVDLNRPRSDAVYEQPEDAWGLQLWRDPPPPKAVVERSLDLYDSFYAEVATHLDAVAADGPFVVLDLHSYNHRRAGAPEPAAENPDINVGTGSLDRQRWAPLVDGFMADLSRQTVRGAALDVRENVRFRGGHFSGWVNESWPGRGCALAIEFKKTFMDEWTGEVDDDHLDELRAALAATLPGLLASLGAVSA